MVTGQLILDLAPPRRQQFLNYVAAPSDPVSATLQSGLEDGQWYFLAGPRGAGKSHLAAAVFHQAMATTGTGAAFLPMARLSPEHRLALLAQEVTGLVVVDDVDALAGSGDQEEALFHALNRWKEAGVTVVMTGAGRSGMILPDLRSRLGAAVRLTLSVPDDTRRTRILHSLAEEFELSLRPRAREYLMTHGPRNLKEQVRLMERLREKSLADRRPVTVPLIKEVMNPT